MINLFNFSIEFYTKVPDIIYTTFVDDSALYSSGFITANFSLKIEIIEYFKMEKIELVNFKAGIEDNKFLQ